MAFFGNARSRGVGPGLLEDGSVAVVGASATKGVGYVRDLALAIVFGTGNDLDLFFLVFLVSPIPLRIWFNSLQSGLIRELVRIRTRGEDPPAEAADVLRSLLTTSTRNVAVLLVLGCLLATVAAGGLGGYEWDTAVMVTLCLAPYVFLTNLNLLLYGSLQASRRFLPDGLLPAILPLTVSLLLFANRWLNLDPFVLLLWGTNLGAALETALLFRIQSIRLSVATEAHQGSIEAIKRDAKLLLTGGMAQAAAPTVINLVSASLGAGFLSSLTFASKVPSIATGLAVTTLSVVLLPHFAGMGSSREVRNSAVKVSLTATLVLVPVLSLAVLFSRELVTLLFEHGRFDSESTVTVAKLQEGYFVGVLPAVLFAILSRALIASGQSLANSISAVLGALAAVAFTVITPLVQREELISYSPGLGAAVSALAAFLVLWHRDSGGCR